MRTPSLTTTLYSESTCHYLLVTILDHADPSFSPTCPDTMDWSEMYPAYVAPGQEETVPETVAATEENGQVFKVVKTPKTLTQNVEVADIGCGYGGLLMALGLLMPDTLCLGRLSVIILYIRGNCDRKDTNQVL